MTSKLRRKLQTTIQRKTADPRTLCGRQEVCRLAALFAAVLTAGMACAADNWVRSDSQSSVPVKGNVPLVRIDAATSDADDSFEVEVHITDLNIRIGPGINYGRTGAYTGKGTFEITEVASGEGSKAGWGRLKSGTGWISLDYATRIWFLCAARGVSCGRSILFLHRPSIVPTEIRI